jgi:hypothetical protein
MASISPRDMWGALASTVGVGVIGIIGIVLVGCTPGPLPSDGGQTTTTYNGSNGTTDPDGNSSEVTDDGPDDSTGTGTDPDPSDTNDGPDDSGPDDGDPPPFDVFVPVDVGNPDGLPDGSTCTSDVECISGSCYVLPFLGGTCGQCNGDADCFGGGCTPPNPFNNTPPFCNMGEPGAGCESDEVCGDGLSCGNVFDLLNLIELNTCGSCLDDAECGGDQLCAPLFELALFGGQLDCIDPQSLPQDAFCDLEGNGNEVCASGICSVIDVMGLAQLGACGQCNVDGDCNGGFCVPGEFLLDTAELTGSTCQ